MSGKKERRERFRRLVQKRDGCCRKCGATESLEIHHITDRHEMPNGGYVPENGIALCPACHRKAERFHETGVAEEGFRPADLYEDIGFSRDEAMAADGAPVCVRHREGWCATRKRTLSYGDLIKTACDHYVIGPFGIERRMPDCPECLEWLKGR